MQRALHGSRYLRLLEDMIPDKSIFVYRYLKDHLLSLAQKDLPLLLTKRILNNTLRGIAELYYQNIGIPVSLISFRSGSINVRH